MDEAALLSSETIPEFTHKPLSTSQPSIRLLRFVDKTPFGLLQAELREFDLDELPPYRALSYMWGTGADKEETHINQQRFAVRQNLFQLFQIYEERHLGEWVWADQVG